MCQYLYAAFSLKSTAGPGLRADQLEAVESWRRVIFAIAGEEMRRRRAQGAAAYQREIDAEKSAASDPSIAARDAAGFSESCNAR